MSFTKATHDMIKKAFLEADKILMTTHKSTNGYIGREIKLGVDMDLDLHFRTILKNHSNFPVYSEESLGTYPDKKTTCWIVDPLDGSLNYFNNIPFYTSSVCLWEAGKPVIGAIYDYSRSDFYYAEKGKGAVLNNKKIRSRPSQYAIKATGIPSHSSLEDSLRMFSTSLDQYKKLRWFGCASLSMAYLASGKIDAYEELGIKLWDVAAGITLVEEAGGSVDYSFNNNGTLNLLAR